MLLDDLHSGKNWFQPYSISTKIYGVQGVSDNTGCWATLVNEKNPVYAPSFPAIHTNIYIFLTLQGIDVKLFWVLILLKECDGILFLTFFYYIAAFI